MNKTITFSIPGEPTGKGRPKFSTAGGFPKAYTPEATAKYENFVKCMYIEKYGNNLSFDSDAALNVIISAHFSIPKATSKKKKRDMEAGIIRPTKKPDCDNIAKIILDALNGLAFPDDKQVVYISIDKRYVHWDILPQVIVHISNV